MNPLKIKKDQKKAKRNVCFLDSFRFNLDLPSKNLIDDHCKNVKTSICSTAKKRCFFHVDVNKLSKLIPNLKNKNEYMIRHENFTFYESLGMRIIKIHKRTIFKKVTLIKSL